MSSQRGNVNKKGPPKHQNKTKFKNTLHDTSGRTKQIVSLEVSGVCQRCKDIIDWKIKYKKYKPLTLPKKCIKCAEKTVKRAYYIICQPCATRLHICAKCGETSGVVLDYGLEPSQAARQESEMNFELRNLSERKRRAFFRMQEKGDSGRDGGAGKGAESEDSCSDIEEDEIESLTKKDEYAKEHTTKGKDELFNSETANNETKNIEGAIKYDDFCSSDTYSATRETNSDNADERSTSNSEAHPHDMVKSQELTTEQDGVTDGPEMEQTGKPEKRDDSKVSNSAAQELDKGESSNLDVSRSDNPCPKFSELSM